MPETHPDDTVGDCVTAIIERGLSKSDAHAICEARSADDISGTELATMLKANGADEWVATVGRMVRSDVEATVIADVVQRARSGASRHEAQKAMAKSAKIEKVGFEAQMDSKFTVFKAGDDDFIIWGPASVQIVDKEGDKIQAKALQKALPQLLKRARLSLEHSDQLVGRILERFDTDQDVEIEIDDRSFKRSDFPTDVLELDGMEPALYVAGEIWDDSRQARETRKDIENGDLNSYSISGEALVTQKRVTSEGDTYDDIVDIDLSAVTICEEGMNQKAKFAQIAESGEKEAAATAKSDDANTPIGEAEAPPERAVAQIAKDALSETMSDTQQGGDDPAGGFNPQELTAEFKSVLDTKLPDGNLATKDDTLSREDVASIAREVYRAKGPEDDEEEAPVPDEDKPAPDEEEAPVPEDEGDDKPPEEAKGTTKDDALVALANEFDVSEEKILEAMDHLADKGASEEDRDGDDDYDEAEAEEEAGPDADEEDEEKTSTHMSSDRIDTGSDRDRNRDRDDDKADDEPPAPEDEEEAPAPDEDEEPAPEDEEEAPAPEDEDKPAPPEEEAKEGFSEEELEEMLPSDVYEVVREYLDQGGPGGEGPGGEADTAGDEGEEVMAASKQDDIEQAVNKILSGNGLEKTEGADAPSGDVEKSYDDESDVEQATDNPALTNFY